MSTEETFGLVATAMVTPFTDEDRIDIDGAQRLAQWLTADGRNDALIVNGTTGEAATTSDREKDELLRAVLGAVDHSTRVVAGVGSADTRHSVELARAAESAGAHALLVVAPYYCKPSQEGILRHFLAVADSTSLPVMLYDVPHRTGVPVESATLVRAAEHDLVRAVKDAKGDLEAATWVMRRASLAYYSGADSLNLPMLAIGATGFVSVVGHVVASELRAMLVAYREGRVGEAARIHSSLLPIYQGIFRAPASALVKAALEQLGLPGGRVRPPLVDATPEEQATLHDDLLAGGVQSTRVLEVTG